MILEVENEKNSEIGDSQFSSRELKVPDSVFHVSNSTNPVEPKNVNFAARKLAEKKLVELALDEDFYYNFKFDVDNVVKIAISNQNVAMLYIFKIFLACESWAEPHVVDFYIICFSNEEWQAFLEVISDAFGIVDREFKLHVEKVFLALEKLHVSIKTDSIGKYFFGSKKKDEIIDALIADMNTHNYFNEKGFKFVLNAKSQKSLVVKEIRQLAQIMEQTSELSIKDQYMLFNASEVEGVLAQSTLSKKGLSTDALYRLLFVLCLDLRFLLLNKNMVKTVLDFYAQKLNFDRKEIRLHVRSQQREAENSGSVLPTRLRQSLLASSTLDLSSFGFDLSKSFALPTH